jgi:hypothetical protein
MGDSESGPDGRYVSSAELRMAVPGRGPCVDRSGRRRRAGGDPLSTQLLSAKFCDGAGDSSSSVRRNSEAFLRLGAFAFHHLGING